MHLESETDLLDRMKRELKAIQEEEQRHLADREKLDKAAAKRKRDLDSQAVSLR